MGCLSMPSPGSISRGLILNIDDGEVVHNGPFGVRQCYERYTDEDHRVWGILVGRQLENLWDIAYTPWLSALVELGLDRPCCPSFVELSRCLRVRTGWTMVAVDRELKGHDYFWYLSNSLFPAIPRLRSFASLRFVDSPDLFHDAFGHAPMHADPVFSRFINLFAQVVCRLPAQSRQATEMARLYWFAVEYGLIIEDGKLKVCGSGHLSGIDESRYSLTDQVRKYPFDLKMVIRQEYDPKRLQNVLFVLDSYDQLIEAVLDKANEYGLNVVDKA